MSWSNRQKASEPLEEVETSKEGDHSVLQTPIKPPQISREVRASTPLFATRREEPASSLPSLEWALLLVITWHSRLRKKTGPSQTSHQRERHFSTNH